MGDAAVIAEMFRYPSPGRAGELAAMIDRVSDPAITEALAAFVGTVTELELGEWEELHTRTLDLSPAVVPYVGHVVWGENYTRGEFMAKLVRAMRAAQVDLDGELPDHLAPILRLYDTGAERPAELDQVAVTAVEKMRAELARSDRHNPYVHVFDAALHLLRSIGVPA